MNANEEKIWKRIAVANLKADKMTQMEMRGIVVKVLISDYLKDPEFLQQDYEIYLKEKA